jgi:hypothetical protein
VEWDIFTAYSRTRKHLSVEQISCGSSGAAARHLGAV